MAEVTSDVYSKLVVAINSYLTDGIGCNEWQYTNQLGRIGLIGPGNDSTDILSVPDSILFLLKVMNKQETNS